MVHLCDNWSELTEVNGWIREGGKATSATAPNKNIIWEVLCTLRTRIEAGSTTFLVKVKSHRGEPINVQADDLADEGRREPYSSVWTTRPERMVFNNRENKGEGGQFGHMQYAIRSGARPVRRC